MWVCLALVLWHKLLGIQNATRLLCLLKMIVQRILWSHQAGTTISVTNKGLAMPELSFASQTFCVLKYEYYTHPAIQQKCSTENWHFQTAINNAKRGSPPPRVFYDVIRTSVAPNAACCRHMVKHVKPSHGQTMQPGSIMTFVSALRLRLIAPASLTLMLSCCEGSKQCCNRKDPSDPQCINGMIWTCNGSITKQNKSVSSCGWCKAQIMQECVVVAEREGGCTAGCNGSKVCRSEPAKSIRFSLTKATNEWQSDKGESS